MTTLYKPVLIESAEQAEALPDGTLFRAPSEPFAPHFYVKEGGALYEHDGGYMRVGPVIIGWTALVPIEAEEETVEERVLCQKTPDVLRRYITPWVRYTPRGEAV